MQLLWLLFSFWTTKAINPKVLTGNLQRSLIRECHCRKALETTSFLPPVLWHEKSPEGLMHFYVIFPRYHYILDFCVLHLIKISFKKNAKISVYLFKDRLRISFYISRSKHAEFFFHSNEIFPDQFFGYYTVRMRIHRQTSSGTPPWLLQIRKLF